MIINLKIKHQTLKFDVFLHIKLDLKEKITKICQKMTIHSLKIFLTNKICYTNDVVTPFILLFR